MPVASFYSHFANPPHFNMAFDDWLLMRSLELPGSTFLRLYSWRPGAITFGFNQRQEMALDWNRIGTTDAIRRITGGRAIYHDPSEITYSIAVNSHNHSSPKLIGSNSHILTSLAQGLSSFLAGLGLESNLVRQSAPQNAQPAFFHKAPCFSSTAKYELISSGRKVVASAQKRLGDAMLQHGSIKLHGIARHPALDLDVDAIDDYPVALDENRFRHLAELFRQLMGQALAVDFIPSSESAKEILTIDAQANVLKESPWARRELIKQSGAASSL